MQMLSGLMSMIKQEDTGSKVKKEDLVAFERALASAQGVVNEVCLERGEFFGFTLLGYASHRHAIAFARVLLADPSINVNLEGVGQSAPLHLAVIPYFRKPVDMVSRLLSAPGIDVNQSDGRRTREMALSGALDGIENALWPSPERDEPYYTQTNLYYRADFCTPLYYACASENLHSVRELLAQPDIDVNAGSSVRSPLHAAARNYFPFCFRALLEHPQIDVNRRSAAGRTALFEVLDDAAERKAGFEFLDGEADEPREFEFVRALLSRSDFDPAQIVEPGAGLQSPLSLASKRGDWRLVLYLMSRVPNCGAGGQPLVEAVRAGDLQMARVLLSSPHTDVNAAGQIDERTIRPIHVAACAQSDKGEMLDLLLAHPRIDVQANDDQGRTPLLVAIGADNTLAVGKLAARTDAEAYAGLAPLAVCQSVRMLDLVTQLRGDRASSDSERTGQLCRAIVLQNKPLAADMLREHPLNGDVVHEGAPLLHWAVKHDCCVAEVARATSNLNAQDVEGATALFLAVRQYSLRKAVPPLFKESAKRKSDGDAERQPIDTNVRAVSGETALHLAARQSEFFLQYFLKNAPEADVTATDKRGRTPFLTASAGNKGSAFFLAGRPEINVAARDYQGVAALHSLVCNCDMYAAELSAFVLRRDVDVNVIDADGRTPLHYAVASCSLVGVVALLSRDDIDVNRADSFGRTPHEIAAEIDSCLTATDLEHGWRRLVEISAPFHATGPILFYDRERSLAKMLEIQGRLLRAGAR